MSREVSAYNDHDDLLKLKNLVWSNHDLLLDWTDNIKREQHFCSHMSREVMCQ
jgi:hypothetical protein